METTSKDFIEFTAHKDKKATNDSLFMEEVQKYESLYNKFSKDYKNKYLKVNIWGEKMFILIFFSGV